MLYPRIGLEVHIEVKTASKMFCACKNEPDQDQPNINICPICTGHPGTLPVANEQAMHKLIALGYLLNGTIARKTHFERKHYFYPDLPKGYQITQYAQPTVTSGLIALESGKQIHIRRIHIEEDTGKLVHHNTHTNVDFNRAGIPLIELVTEPDITSPEEAFEFTKKLREVLVFNDISDASMEKGHMRLEANISLATTPDSFGTKVEVKNLNSFKSLKDAITFEIARQTQLLNNQEKIAQETRGWNENKGESVAQRTKEESEDYRYFREPDIPTIEFNEQTLLSIKKSLAEDIETTKQRFATLYHSKPKTIEALFSNVTLQRVIMSLEREYKIFDTNYIPVMIATINLAIPVILSLVKEQPLEHATLEARELHTILTLFVSNKINNIIAKEFITLHYTNGTSAQKFLADHNIDPAKASLALEPIIADLIAAHPEIIAGYRAGNQQVLGFLIGQGMKLTKGVANPKELQKLLIAKLSQ